MKIFKLKLVRLSTAFVLFSLFFNSCYDDLDDNLVAGSASVELEIKDFVWKAMNAVYLYKDEISDLDDNRFSTDEEYNTYLEEFDSPELLFNSLLFRPETVDRFSIIVDDYVALEQRFSGVFKTNGLEYLLYIEPGTQNEVFGIIRLVLNNSVADQAGLVRGMIFTGINGTELNRDNFSDLINQETLTLNFADYNDNGTDDPADDVVTANGNSITLTAAEYTENPVHRAEILEVDGENVGYLVYNGFTNEFDEQLNDAFGLFKSNNVTNLVLDLRYNPGGSVRTASYLGSLIAGQFEGQVFSKLIYNQNLSENNRDYNFVNSINGGSTLNSLGLNKVYIIATSRSASASELVINSLDEYIDVIHIGGNTVGKTQASITVYDSPDLGREDRNPRHTYALQPLVANSVNKSGNGVPGNGLNPDIAINETPRDFDELGDPTERLLAAALADIQGTSRLREVFDYNIETIDTEINVVPFHDALIIDDKIEFKRKLSFDK